jgi:hypothetical protein
VIIEVEPGEGWRVFGKGGASHRRSPRAGVRLTMHWARPSGNQGGTSTLEFLAVLTTLLLIFLASLELSRAWLTANILTTGLRDGVRVAAVTPGVGDLNCPEFNPTPALNRSNAILSSANLTAASVSVTCTPPLGMCGCVRDSQVQANGTINFTTVVPLFLPVLGTATLPVVLQQTALMRRE